MDIITVGFSGSGGGQMRDLCDYNVIIPSTTTMNIQECHLALEHIFCMLVECHYFATAPNYVMN
jgi:D-sedoheptulose 7-phosphate isomerase